MLIFGINHFFLKTNNKTIRLLMRNLYLFFWGFVVSLSSYAQTSTAVITASSTKICSGEIVRLTASGCNKQVVWTNGAVGVSIIDTLTSTTTFSSMCMEGENVLFSFNEVKVEVVPLPETPYLFCNGDIIKKGEQIGIKTFGCIGKVKWSNGQEGREILVSPQSTTTYTATCYNEAGCAASPISKTIIVEDGTTTTPQVSWRYGCIGENVIMKANGCTAGVYVWYKHTLFNGNITRSEEIGRGSSVEVNAGGEEVFYTARCLFQECLGDESNRLFINFSNKIATPNVTKELIIDATNQTTVDLASALSSPSTSGGYYEFYTTKSTSAAAIGNSKSIATTGTYYVVEKSREGKCISDIASIIVKNGVVEKTSDKANGVATTPTEETTTNNNPTTSQVTDTGATLASSEPNNELADLGIPEAFSPNGDGKNDLFFIKNISDKIIKLHVYNRYGHLVYTADDYKNDWNGVANTGSQKNASVGLPDGTYYYVVMVNDGRQKISFLTIAR